MPDRLGDHGGRVRALTAGDTLDVAGSTLAVHGERHAAIHPGIPCVDHPGHLNHPGHLVDETLLHPGGAPVRDGGRPVVGEGC